MGNPREHVPPKCLFPEAKDIPGDYRNNLIAVPSCDIHNPTKSQDDEYLLFVLASHYENNAVAKNQFSTKIVRALKKRPNLVIIYQSGQREVLLNDEGTPAFKVDVKRVKHSLQHVVRGLYFHETGEKWPHPIHVHSPAMLRLDTPKAAFLNNFTRMMVDISSLAFRGKPQKGVDVLAMSDPPLKD